ncbi:MAG TPA: hypothetical protein VHT49_05330, partial [Acidimicrobiales bacterium]|nr:hypothetical protein [Acidimicrobiales bacterium]
VSATAIDPERGGIGMVDPDDRGPAEFSESQRSGLERRDFDQDQTLIAMHELEAALSSAAPKRELRWRDDVLSALRVLGEAIGEEVANAERSDSLLSDVSRTQPRLRNRVRGLRTQYRHLQDNVDSLYREVGDPDCAPVDFADLRQRLAWVLTALRHQRARESDLIYEAYYEAFGTDLGQDARDPGSEE